MNGQTITEKLKIAENFFTSIGKKLQNKIHPTNRDYSYYLKRPNPNTFFTSPTSPEEVINIIQDLKRHFVNQHPTSQQTSHIPHPEHPTSRTFHISNIPHPEHSTARTSHIPNIPHPKHPTSQTSHIPNIPRPKHPTFQTERL